MRGNSKYKIHLLELLSKALQARNSKFQGGFTLIELLAVIFVIGIVGGVVFATTVSLLRGTNKSNALTNIRQNGNYAVTQLTKILHDAKRINDPLTSSCDGSALTKKSITVTGFDNAQTTISCSTGANGTIASNSASLINANSILVTACSISCQQVSAADIPRVTVTFTLSQRTTNSLFENQASSSFNATTQLRNASR